MKQSKPYTDAGNTLHAQCRPVDEVMFEDGGAQIKKLASFILEAMNSNLSMGMSACEIGVDLAVFAINTEGVIRVCVNPQLVAASADMASEPETCPSFPGLSLAVRRPVAVVARYLNIEGTEVTEHLEGESARAWLHEYDHVNGICFTDRVSKLKLNMAKKRAAKMERKGTR